jgi:CheY-like chemotaxis protein
MVMPVFHGFRFLVVEDDYFVAEEIVAVLRDSGAEVVGPFARVQPAIDSVERVAVDGAVLDFRLDGETTEQLATLLLARNVPVLLATGYESGQLPPVLRRLPSLRKPFNQRELLEALPSGLEITFRNPSIKADERQVSDRRDS